MALRNATREEGWRHKVASTKRRRGLAFLAEALDVFRGFLKRQLGAALHELANLLDDVGIRESGNVAGVDAIGNGGENAAHDFARTGLGHVGNDLNGLRPGDLADHSLNRVRYFSGHILGTGRNSRLERNVNLRHAALDFVHHGYDRRFGDLRDGQASRFELFGTQPMAGHVDDVIYPAKDSEVTVFGEQCAIACKVRPVTPIFALGILAVLLVIRPHKAIAVSPDGLKDPGPGIADANVSSLLGTSRHLLLIFVVNDRVNPWHARPRASWLHRVDGRLRTAKEPAVLRLPPGVDNHGLALADGVVIPFPDFRLDRLADGGHVLEVAVVLFRLVGSGFPQHADGRRRGVEDIHIESLGDSPGTASVGVDGNAFIHDAGGGQSERPIDDIGVAGDPSDIRHAPIDVLGMDVLNVFGSPGDIGQVAAGSMLASLGFSGGSAGVHKKEGSFGVHWNRLDPLAAKILQDFVNKVVPPFNHRRG